MRVTTAFNKMLGIVGATVVSVSFSPVGMIVGLRRRRSRRGLWPFAGGQVTVMVRVCQPVAPSGAGGAVSVGLGVAVAVGGADADRVVAGRGVPRELPLHPGVVACAVRPSSASCHSAVVDLHLDLVDAHGRAPRRRRRSAAARRSVWRPTRHVDARLRLDRSLLRPAAGHPVAVEVLPRGQLDLASSHFVADT